MVPASRQHLLRRLDVPNRYEQIGRCGGRIEHPPRAQHDRSYALTSEPSLPIGGRAICAGFRAGAVGSVRALGVRLAPANRR
jgi:hypothetical protein